MQLNNINLKKQRGFTLFELLVVVSIIGIMVSLVTVSMSEVQKRGRDGQRKADLKQVQSALEMFFNNNNAAYPSDVFNNLWGRPWSTDGVDYMRKVPSDPLAAQQYCYHSSATNSYSLYAKLENASDPDKGGPYSACSRNDYNYQIQNPL